MLAIDDYDDRDLPLVKARASSLQARIRDIINPISPAAVTAAAAAAATQQHVITAASQIKVQIDYYNGRIGAWEPMLEPVGFSGTFRREDGLITTTIVDVAAMDTVGLNVTDAALELILRTLQDWQEEEKEEKRYIGKG